MRLSKIAILAVKGASPGIVELLAEAIHVSEPSIYRFINDNDDNLTKAAALKVIREETGLTDDQILEEEKTEEPPPQSESQELKFVSPNKYPQP